MDRARMVEAGAAALRARADSGHSGLAGHPL